MRILSCPEETLRLQCKRCPIFKKLSDEEFATFLPGVTLVEYAKQDLIMDEDADADCCFMVISGHARLFHNMPDGPTSALCISWARLILSVSPPCSVRGHIPVRRAPRGPAAFSAFPARISSLSHRRATPSLWRSS